MNLENALSVPIQVLQGVVFTPVLMLVAVLSFIFLLVFYHWSGLAEKVENMATGKKALVFLFVSLIIFALYYVFYKAGKFNVLVSSSVFKEIKDVILKMVARR